MDTNYGIDTNNRYTGYLDSSDHGAGTNAAAAKNKRKTKKKRRTKNPAQKAEQTTVVDASTNTSQVIESDAKGNDDADNNAKQQQQQQQIIDDRSGEVDNVERRENDTLFTDGPSSLNSCCSTVQTDTSKEEAKESDAQSDCPAGAAAAPPEERKWSVICCEEEQAAAAAVQDKIDKLKLRDEPESVFKDQRVYPTVYFYNSNFGSRNRRVVYDFHDGRRQSNNHYYHQQRHHYSHQHDRDSVEPNRDQAPSNRKGMDRRGPRNSKRRPNHYVRNDTADFNSVGDTGETHSGRGDDTEKFGSTSHNEPVDRASHGQSTPPPPPSPSTQKYNNNATREFLKHRYNKFKNGGPERTFTRRRTDLVRNV